jgi:hypothetical protein
MSHHAVKQTATSLDGVISEIENLRAHPRVQQKTWVASAARWLPILRQARAHLEDWNEPSLHVIELQRADPGNSGLRLIRMEHGEWLLPPLAEIEIDALEGRELDAAVAAYKFGWQQVRRNDVAWYGQEPGSQSSATQVPPYSRVAPFEFWRNTLKALLSQA